jgi:hypothetical protein
MLRVDMQQGMGWEVGKQLARSAGRGGVMLLAAGQVTRVQEVLGWTRWSRAAVWCKSEVMVQVMAEHRA